MIKVSIVIPIYNPGERLRDCLDSICNQILKEIEIICINDGSTDNSQLILQEYSKKDKRIVVHSKTNEGVSIARNKGMAMARGEYITFVDSDDYIDPMMYKKMYSSIGSSDLCMCNFNVKYENRVVRNKLPLKEGQVKGDDIVQKIACGIIIPQGWNKNYPYIMGSCCRMLVSKKMIQKNNILFPINIPLMEDTIFCLHVLLHTKSVQIVEDYFYNYLSRETGALRSYRNNRLQLELLVANYIHELLVKHGEKDYKDLIGFRMISSYLMTIKGLLNSDLSFSEKYKQVKYNLQEAQKLAFFKNMNLSNSSFQRQFEASLIKSNSSLGIIVYYLFINTYNNFKGN